MIIPIVINGAGTSGKDTFIDLFEEVCRETGNPYRVARYSSVDEVKYYARNMGWNGEKDSRGRRFLSDIKDALTRYDDLPFKFMERKFKDFSDYCITHKEVGFVFFHVREPEEIKKMVCRLNAETLLIIRQGVEASDFLNHADKNVKGYNYDFYVDNSSTLEELKNSVKDYLSYLVSKRGVNLSACT